MLLLGSAVVLGAFLLFLVQPLAGKQLLPLFGGTAAVWSACLLFFQTVLLLGYFYAHALTRLSRPRGQAVFHSLLVAACLIAPRLQPSPGADSVHVMAALAGAFGLPYFLLCSTSPLLQHWLALLDPASRPYKLSAWANLACAGALFAFPFFLEPRWPLPILNSIWRALFTVQSLLLIGVACLLWLRNPAGAPRPIISDTPAGTRLAWLLWPALGSAFLVATSAHLCQAVAPAPLLWVAPMFVYLLTFVIVFAREPQPSRRPTSRALIGLLAMASSMLYLDLQAVFAAKVALHSLGLFLVCLYAHHSLALLKPSPAGLTSFWTHAAAGGALGSFAAGFLAPSLLKGYFELPLLMAAAGGICVWRLWGTSRWARQAAAMGAILAATPALALVQNYYSGLVEAGRNFYGSIRILDESAAAARPPLRKMLHGMVAHGSQFLEADLALTPTAYYSRSSAAGLLLSRPGPPRRVGVVGLGTGTLAAYARPGDRFRFYEINPMVIDFARRHFTFLRQAAAAIDIVEGDARLSLASEPPAAFDVLVIDAFSGDSIPTHLLTRQAFDLYLRHLAPSGVLALHISNQYADLAPVVRALAAAAGRPCTRVASPPDPGRAALAAVWMVVDTSRSAPVSAVRSPYLWTDEWNSLLGVLR